MLVTAHGLHYPADMNLSKHLTMVSMRVPVKSNRAIQVGHRQASGGGSGPDRKERH